MHHLKSALCGSFLCTSLLPSRLLLPFVFQHQHSPSTTTTALVDKVLLPFVLSHPVHSGLQPLFLTSDTYTRSPSYKHHQRAPTMPSPHTNFSLLDPSQPTLKIASYPALENGSSQTQEETKVKDMESIAGWLVDASTLQSMEQPPF